MTNYLKKSIIVGVYFEGLVLILWILFNNEWIYRTVKANNSEVFTKYWGMLPHLFGTIFVVNGILLVVLVLAAIITDKIYKVKNNK